MPKQTPRKKVSHELSLLSGAQDVLYNAQRINGVYTGRTSIMAIRNLEIIVDNAIATQDRQRAREKKKKKTAS